MLWFKDKNIMNSVIKDVLYSALKKRKNMFLVSGINLKIVNGQKLVTKCLITTLSKLLFFIFISEQG